MSISETLGATEEDKRRDAGVKLYSKHISFSGCYILHNTVSYKCVNN